MTDISKIMRRVIAAQAMTGGFNSDLRSDLSKLDKTSKRIIGPDRITLMEADHCHVCGRPGWMHSELGECPT